MNYLAEHHCAFCSRRIEDDELKENGSVCRWCLNRWNEQNDGCMSAKANGWQIPQNIRSVTNIGIYGHNEDSMCRKIILAQKENRNISAECFCARQLISALDKRQLLSQNNIFVTNVPRSREKVRLYGFDQSALVAKRIAKAINRPYIPCIKYIGRNIEQKSLSAEERESNAQSAYRINDAYLTEIAFMGCILVDDVITTGSTVSACAELMLESGVRFIDCAVIGRTRK